MAASMMAAGALTGCSESETAKENNSVETAKENNSAKTEIKAEAEKIPKYVFLFIGDGMSYPQVQLTNYFVSANAEKTKTVIVEGEEKCSEEQKQFDDDGLSSLRFSTDI